jgi:hypothetical protein
MLRCPLHASRVPSREEMTAFVFILDATLAISEPDPPVGAEVLREVKQAAQGALDASEPKRARVVEAARDRHWMIDAEPVDTGKVRVVLTDATLAVVSDREAFWKSLAHAIRNHAFTLSTLLEGAVHENGDPEVAALFRHFASPIAKLTTLAAQMANPMAVDVGERQAVEVQALVARALAEVPTVRAASEITSNVELWIDEARMHDAVVALLAHGARLVAKDQQATLAVSEHAERIELIVRGAARAPLAGLEDVWKPFHLAERGGDGRLAAARAIVVAHGGEVIAEKVGAEFRLGMRLPRRA